MLRLNRSPGEALVIEAPAGRVRLLVTAVTNRGATFEIQSPDGSEIAIRRYGENFRLKFTGDAVLIELTANQHRRTVGLRIDAPRSWPVVREEIIIP